MPTNNWEFQEETEYYERFEPLWKNISAISSHERAAEIYAYETSDDCEIVSIFDTRKHTRIVNVKDLNGIIKTFKLVPKVKVCWTVHEVNHADKN